jgi:hypothetical protein
VTLSRTPDEASRSPAGDLFMVGGVDVVGTVRAFVPAATYSGTTWCAATASSSCATTLAHVFDADIRGDGTPVVLTGVYTADRRNGTLVAAMVPLQVRAGLRSRVGRPRAVSTSAKRAVAKTTVNRTVTVTNSHDDAAARARQADRRRLADFAIVSTHVRGRLAGAGPGVHRRRDDDAVRSGGPTGAAVRYRRHSRGSSRRRAVGHGVQLRARLLSVADRGIVGGSPARVQAPVRHGGGHSIAYRV